MQTMSFILLFIAILVLILTYMGRMLTEVVTAVVIGLSIVATMVPRHVIAGGGMGMVWGNLMMRLHNGIFRNK